MPNEQVVVLDPPLRVASYSEKFNELFENLDCIKDEISIYSSTQNDQTRSELSIVKLNLIMAINGIKSLLLPYISELLDDLVASNSLKREINNLNDDLEFVKSTRTSFAETSSSRDLKQVLSYANFALNGIKCIREKVEKILNLKFVYINSVEGWFAGIRADYKLIGSLLHVRNDSNLSMIQERIDRISKPLFGFPNEPGDTDEGSMTFIAFVGPSLTGKSQMAFTLAHRQPVLYFNFTSNNQPIYTPFKEISQVMIDFLQQDFKKLKQSTDVGDFPGAQWLSENHLIPLSSLGFLHELVKVGLDFSDTEGYWFDKYLRLNMIAMDELSIADFQRKLGNLLRTKIEDLKREIPNISNGEIRRRIKIPVIFIDEFSKNNEYIFLRNLVRTILLPCIVASTDSKVANMISSNKKTSRFERMNYCKLVRLFPVVSVQGALKTAKIKIADIEYPLDNFMESETNQINFERLPGNINDNINDQDRENIQKLLKLILSQSETCHQGIMGICLSKVCELFQEQASDKSLFKILIEYLAKQLSEKKDFKADEIRQFYTIFTFALSPHLIDNEYKSLGFASGSINSHYYHFGTDKKEPSVFELKRLKSMLLNQASDKPFVFSSHFSKFKENSLMMIALWQSLFEDMGDRTVANVVQTKYNREPEHWQNAFAKSNDSDPQEFMATFALAHASHKTLPEPVDGLGLLENFAKQVQTTSKRISAAPENLEKFLKSIKIPYLIPHNADDASLDLLKEFLQLGVCRRAQNAEGVDVLFSILDHGIEGFVECKNRKKNMSRVDALEYIIKAINARRPLAIMMCKEIGPSVQSGKKFNEFSDKRVKLESSATQTESQAENQIETEDQTSNESEKVSFTDAINNDPKLKVRDFNMNIYSLTRAGSDSLKYAVLHETSNPHGVFIIVQSDCEFSL